MDLVNLWSSLQVANPDLASPYFTAEFTLTVAAIRDDVEVAVIEDAGRPAAIFPFQRSGRKVGIPVAGVLSDYQGLICPSEFQCDAADLVRKCRLSAWDFDHLLASQACFAPFHLSREPSPIIDLSKGFAAYAATCNAVKTMQRNVRRIEQEVGPLRFVAEAKKPGLLDQVLAWKSEQYRESANHDLFAPGWTRQLVQHIHRTRTENFAGMLSLLYAGDRLVAGHFGMRSRAVWHYWFPAYDETMAKYSPGLLLLLKMAEHALSMGLLVIDLGKGTNLYKSRLMNGSVSLAAGSVEVPSWLAFRRGARRKLKSFIGGTPLAGLARRVVCRTRNDSKDAKT